MQTEAMQKRVAIIGAGISGLTVAWLLDRHQPEDRKAFEITVFDSADRIGGHTATVDVEEPTGQLAIDTGFIVYNDWTYPQFIRLLNELGVGNQPTEMSFSVSCADTKLEYSGNNLDTLFAQRRNMCSPAYLKMLWDILRFNRQSVRDLEEGLLPPSLTLGEYLHQKEYQGLFVSHYLIPMCAAIWSASFRNVLEMPVDFFIRFFRNHGLLSITNRPQWRVIAGGSRQYLAPLTAGYSDRIRLNARIARVLRSESSVELQMLDGSTEHFDEVIFACHSDQALALLADAGHVEKELLGAIRYQESEVVLHTDDRLLPVNRKTWAAWNYLLSADQQDAAVLTYNMNILQSLGNSSGRTYCVTLNASDRIASAKVIGRYCYAHPQFSLAAIDAQRRWADINGSRRTWFCGAYWGNGFHEDGVVSARRVAAGLGVVW